MKEKTARERGGIMSVKIIPHKKHFLPLPGQETEYWEICGAFEPGERFANTREIEARCIFCKNAEFHGGYDCVDKRGGCVCLAGKDPGDNGQHKANIREESQ